MLLKERQLDRTGWQCQLLLWRRSAWALSALLQLLCTLHCDVCVFSCLLPAEWELSEGRVFVPSVSQIPTTSLGKSLAHRHLGNRGLAVLALLPAQTLGPLGPGWASVGKQLFASAPFQVDNAYWLWTFQGRLLQKNNKDRFCQLLWRPRPPTLLSQDQIKVWCPQEVKGLWKRCGTQRKLLWSRVWSRSVTLGKGAGTKDKRIVSGQSAWVFNEFQVMF